VGGEPRLTGWTLRLGSEPIGSVHAVERLLRRDILGPDHPHALDRVVGEAATEVLVNALVGAWAVDRLPAAAFDEMMEPYRQAVAAHPLQLPELGPAGPQLTELLVSPLHNGPAIAARWAAVTTQPPDSARWAQVMHRGCWAAHLSGRIRTVAAAQLLAVQAFATAQLGPRELGGGLWNLFAGAVQATVVADLLDEDTIDALEGPWRLFAD
jgi:hypothetical protein